MSSLRPSPLRAYGSDPRLSKYNPLARILFYDDFDEGMNGWCELVGNHAGDLRDIRKMALDFRPPQLSTCSYFDIGTHGSMEGTYSLKVATRNQPNHLAVAIKRVTSAATGLVQFETYFAFKAEQVVRDRIGRLPGQRNWDGNAAPSELQFGEVTFSNDICSTDPMSRCHGVVRYRNTDPGGNLVQHWMYPTTVEPTTKMERMGLVKLGHPNQDFFSLAPEDWKPVPNGDQPLCFNETASKVNWHYVRWLFDTETSRNVEFQCNDRVMDLSEIEVPKYDEPYHGLPNLLNFYLAVRTHTNVRNFLYLDSVLVSVDW